MPTTATTLVQRVRRFIGDWPELDTTSASIAAGGTSLQVADTTKYAVNWNIQLDQEMLRVTALTDSTHLAVARGAQGTTATTHVTSSTVLIKPAFSDLQILDSLNAGINATWPFFYKSVLDTSLTADGSTYEYTVPAGLLYLSKVECKESGSPYYYRISTWTVKRGATATLQFATPPIQGTIRCYGYGPFAQLAFADSLDAQWPAYGDDPLVEYAAQRLLMSGEALRVRQDTGARDDRESANRTGSSGAAAGQILQRFLQRMQQQPMPPMPRHLVRTF